MKAPGITTSMGGKNKTLYMQTVKSIEAKTRENLKLSLKGDLMWLLHKFRKSSFSVLELFFFGKFIITVFPKNL